MEEGGEEGGGGMDRRATMYVSCSMKSNALSLCVFIVCLRLVHLIYSVYFSPPTSIYTSRQHFRAENISEILALQREPHRFLEEVTRALDTPVRVDGSALSGLQLEIVQVDAARQSVADGFLPVDAGVVGAGDSLAIRVADDGPSRLGNPDGFALGCADGVGVRLPEGGVCVADGVSSRGVGLVVGVGVHAEEVHC